LEAVHGNVNVGSRDTDNKRGTQFIDQVALVGPSIANRENQLARINMAVAVTLSHRKRHLEFHKATVSLRGTTPIRSSCPPQDKERPKPISRKGTA